MRTKFVRAYTLTKKAIAEVQEAARIKRTSQSAVVEDAVGYWLERVRFDAAKE